MGDAALLETIMVASEAKAEALQAMDLPMTGTPTDAVIAGCEGSINHEYAGRITDIGMRVREAVLHGLPEALKRHDAAESSSTPRFSSSAGSKESTGWNGHPMIARTSPAIFPASDAISATARSTRAMMRISESGRKVQRGERYGTVPIAHFCTNPGLQIT